VNLFQATHVTKLPKLADITNVQNPAEVATGSTTPTNGESRGQGRRLLKVLDDRKTQNLNIAFRKFPCPEDVYDAIMNVNTAVLTGEHVMFLLNEVPSQEVRDEMERTESQVPSGVEYDWDKPEQYLLALACVPNARHVLASWSFAANYSYTQGELPRQLQEFSRACQCLRGSTGLVSLLRTMLAIGNRANANTPRAGAEGIAIDSLLQFDELRSPSDPTTTLLSYCVRRWLSMNKGPAWEDLTDTVGKLRTIRIAPIIDMEADIAKIGEQRQRALDALKYPHDADILIRLDGMISEVSRHVDALQELGKSARNEWDTVLKYFCVKFDSQYARSSSEFFELWRKFLKQVERHVNSLKGSFDFM